MTETDKLLKQILDGNTPEIVDWETRRKERRMHPDIEVDEETSLIKILNTELCTLNNFSAIVGPAKSRKSFLTALLVAAVSKRGIIDDLIEGTEKAQTVIFDTEQSGKHMRQKMRSIEKLSGTFHNIEAYALRPDLPSERVRFIDEYLKAHGHRTDFVILDGVRDLLMDINSPTESTEVASHLMRWTYEHNIHIVAVIHENKDGLGNARGHIGTEISNKAETVIQVRRGAGLGVSNVLCKFSRGLPFRSFQFRITDGGLPEVMGLISDEEF